MDGKLHIIQHLYDEGQADDLDTLLQDEALRAEYESLREVKQLLDQRPRARPRPEILAQVMAAATPSEKVQTATPSKDRSAVPLRLFRNALPLAAALAVSIIVATVVFLNQGSNQPAAELSDVPAVTAPAQPSQALADAAPSAGEGLAEEKVVSSQAGAALSEPVAQETEVLNLLEATVFTDSLERTALAAEVASDEMAQDLEEAMPQWDTSQEMLDLHRNLDLVKARSRDLVWDEASVVSMDVLPASRSSRPAINPVTQPKKGQWP